MSLQTETSPVETTTTWRQDMVAAVLASWLTLGGFVDGFAHRNLDTPETFFTPWHGILYTGYLGAAAWILWLVVSNRPHAPDLRGAIPLGYDTAVAGVVVFAVGGLGDGIWHELLGVEVSVDALLSPTHILLLLGALLIASGPIRSAWMDPSSQPSTVTEFMPPLLAMTVAAAELGFFFQYVDGLSARFMQVPYVAATDDGFFELVAGIASIMITTVILMGALLLLIRRWKPPFGTGLVLFGLFGGLMEILEAYEFPEDLIAPLVAGLAADVIIRYWEPGDRVWAMRALGLLVPLVLWGTRFIVFEQFSDMRWPVSVWTGVLFFSGLAGVGLGLLAFPPSQPPTRPAG